MEATLNLNTNNESLFDLDWDIDLAVVSNNVNNNQSKELATSVSVCTPGCGNTGSFNSFCC